MRWQWGVESKSLHMLGDRKVCGYKGIALTEEGYTLLGDNTYVKSERVYCMEDRNCCNAVTLSNKDRMVLETLWLQYFNSVLLEKGVITEEVSKGMQREILNRSAAKRKSS